MDTDTDEFRTPSTSERLDEVMEVACRIAGRDAIGSIHVAINERPTYGELLHYRRMAEAFGLTLTLKADTIVLRPFPVPDTEPADGAPVIALRNWLPDVRESLAHVGRAVRVCGRSVVSGSGWPSVCHWLYGHVAAWNAGFQGLNEGTR